MRKVFVLLLTLVCGLSLYAEQKSKVIYLWDVTLSMKGYKNLTPDIYDKVVDFLAMDISNADASTEIYVVPFQDKILGEFTNSQGNNDLINKIRNYDKINKLQVTGTDIVCALEYAQRHNSTDKNTNLKVYILTDGIHNTHNGKSASKTDLENELQKWTSSDWDFASNEVFYIMLTRNASGITFPDGGPKPVVNYFLEPKSEVSYNISTDRGEVVVLQFKLLENIALPDNIKVKVTCKDYPQVVHAQEATLNENLEIRVKLDANAAKELFGETETKRTIPLELMVSNKQELLKREALVQIIPNTTNLTIVRKPEKKMTIRYK